MLKYLTVFLFSGLSACAGDETVANYGGAGKIWMLQEIDKRPFVARATLEFGEDGAIGGDAPCNRYFGQQTQPYPWFKADKMGATRRACSELEAEHEFLTALSEMTLSEVVGNTLILSTEDGREMVFSGQP